jgi:hypothetical protein
LRSLWGRVCITGADGRPDHAYTQNGPLIDFR